MIAILLMLNNYLHDFATAMVVVSSYTIFLMIRYVEKDGGVEVKRMLLCIYPRMFYIAVGSFIFLLLAGVIRTLTFKSFEWVEAAGRGQVLALTVKHILLFILFGYGIYLWLVVYRKIRRLRKGMEGL